jgi:hypothetical protein
MRIALSDLGLEKIIVIYPGIKRYSLDKKVEAVPVEELIDQGNLME